MVSTAHTVKVQLVDLIIQTRELDLFNGRGGDCYGRPKHRDGKVELEDVMKEQVAGDVRVLGTLEV